MDKRDYIPPAHVETAWGSIRTDRLTYRPLEEVSVFVTAPAGRAEQPARLVVRDGLGRAYEQIKVALANGDGSGAFLCGGEPGMQFIQLYFGDDEEHSRIYNFYLEPRTGVETGVALYDRFLPANREAIRLNRRRLEVDGREMVGYTTADSIRMLGIWWRDMYYNSLAYPYWERDLTSGWEALARKSAQVGQMLDGIAGDGRTWRVKTESDVEYIAVLSICSTWMVTGDDEWLRGMLPTVERALHDAMETELRWDPSTRLVKRGHTCDTWDFVLEGGGEFDGTRAVIATCDQSGMAAALRAAADIYAALGDEAQAARYRGEAEAYRRRAVDLLWDGEKFAHHHHLHPFDHGAFDEKAQLAMGNTWAMTRAMADHDQCVKIIETYRRHQQQTGDRYPWWSLDPPYPKELGYFPGDDYLSPGGYVNGGLMPWAGGALTTACFEHGGERWALELLADYAELVYRDGGTYTWYWPDGRAGFRTANTTPHDGWGMGHWVEAFVRGLVGVVVTAPRMRTAQVSPRWAASEVRGARCTVHFPASEAYVAYDLRIGGDAMEVLLTGTCEEVRLRLLLPPDKSAGAATMDGESIAVKHNAVESSRYLEMAVSDLSRVRRLRVELAAAS
jgi:hypothetical protein